MAVESELREDRIVVRASESFGKNVTLNVEVDTLARDVAKVGVVIHDPDANVTYTTHRDTYESAAGIDALIASLTRIRALMTPEPRMPVTKRSMTFTTAYDAEVRVEADDETGKVELLVGDTDTAAKVTLSKQEARELLDEIKRTLGE